MNSEVEKAIRDAWRAVSEETLGDVIKSPPVAFRLGFEMGMQYQYEEDNDEECDGNCSL
jgi:hypothetical protein